MDDPHRKPGDRDRSALVARIRRVADAGRIAAADRDIRLANVASARSMSELDLMGRDLDQLEAVLPASGVAAPAQTGPAAPLLADEINDHVVEAAKSTARSLGAVVALVAVIALLGVGASAVLAVRTSGTSHGTSLKDPIPITPSAAASSDGSGATASAGSAYGLTGPGIRAFLELYRTHFHTTQVVDLTLYGDYVVVDVPVPGTSRHEGWLFRDRGFVNFGGVTANSPGLVPVDTQRLAIPALVRNLVRARATLRVEQPTTAYVIVRHDSAFDQVPTVDLHVANQFNESGYLATRLDGTVVRAYPFGQ